jgi:cytochrome c-type biogenesis protein CcmE
MKPHRRNRLIIICLSVVGLSVCLFLLGYAFKQNINLYYSPHEVNAGAAPIGPSIRVGGLVVEGSVKHADKGLDVSFDVTNVKGTVTIHYSGILPDLFREGQGIIALGALKDNNTLVASEVLAKHDEEYMPPEVAE